MKKKIDKNYSLNKKLNLQSRYFSDNIKTTNINILLNRVKIEKRIDFRKKIYLFLTMSLIIIFFSAIVISI